MKYLKTLLTIGILTGIISGFLYINTINYQKHIEIRNNYVKHPEGLPTHQVAKYTSFGFANLRANLYWLKTIQYIGGNALSSEYKKYLYTITDLITELNPYFEHPYIISQLLLPSVNQRYEDITLSENNKNTDDAIKIGLKGVNNFCDQNLLDIVNGESDLEKIRGLNPCKSYKIPYYLAFVYHQYKNDPLSASKYYKIASANVDSVEGAKTMAAIMAGKGGEREKSIFMFLNMAESLDREEGKCSVFSKQLNELSVLIFQDKSLPLTGELIKTIEDYRITQFGLFNEDEQGGNLSDTSCMNYLNKANREINLSYLDQANSIYKSENNNKNAVNGQELFDKKYINFLPTDYQQYYEEGKDSYGIRYEYNEELERFDNKMSY